MTQGISKLARPEIVAMKAYESARSLVASAPASTIFLDANESPFGERGLNRYPEPQPRILVERFSGLYGVPAASIVVGRGSDEAIDLLVRAFCRPSHDAIVICPPTYGVYEIAAEIQGANVVRIPLVKASEAGSPTDYRLDESGIVGALSGGKVKIVFLCSPNNPTGTAFAPESLARIAKLAQGRALVVVDEAYAEFSAEASMVSRLASYENLVVLRTLSKAWALAGARCGVALGSPALASLLHKVRAPYPLSLPAVEVVLAATGSEGQAALAERVLCLQEARDHLARELRKLPGVVEVFPSSANFLLVSFRNRAAVMSATRDAGIIVRDRGREIDGGIRITVGSPLENERLLAVLAKVASS